LHSEWPAAIELVLFLRKVLALDATLTVRL
jgi:hypothetical protein